MKKYKEAEEKSMGKKVYLSDRDKKIAGVCGGIAEYFDLDSTIVRLAWVLFAILAGTGIIAYIIAAIIMPKRANNHRSDIDINNDYEAIENYEATEETKDKNGLLLGLILIVLGVTFLTKNFFPQFPWHWLQFRFLFRNFWPVILIVLGIFTIINGRK